MNDVLYFPTPPAFSMRMAFKDAMKLWSNSTCIRFVPANKTHTNYLLYIEGET
jgi:hypothetical protein